MKNAGMDARVLLIVKVVGRACSAKSERREFGPGYGAADRR